MIKRLFQLAAVALVLLGVATAAGYFGMRVGRKFALNQLCCAIPQRQNFGMSVRETLGLVKFPSPIGQDRWVAERVFPGARNGYFLDVGPVPGGHAPSYIHFMSLDIEGAELEALKGFPFDSYKLGSLAIQHNFWGPKRSEGEKHPRGKGAR